MRINKFLKDAIKSIRKNKSRSLLTALGIIIGVAAVIVMVGVGQGAQQDIKQSIESLGQNMLMVFPASGQRGGISQGAGSVNRFTFDDVEELTENTKYIEYVSAMVRSGGQVIGGGNNWNTSIEGVDVDYLKIRSREIEKGEFFDAKAIRSRKKVAVIGKTVAEELFGDTDPIGQKIRIRSIPFTVIGLLAEKGQDARGLDEDDLIIAPSTSVLYRLKGGKYIDMIYASAKSAEVMDSAKAEITALMREQHRLDPSEEDDFRVLTLSEITEMASSTAKTMTLLLAAIACVSLIVGGIGIMNIMLVSVTERTREIGIRMALGARKKDILLQFLLESIVLSLIGGAIGILLAVGIIALLSKFASFSAVVSPSIVFLSVAFSASVGMFFGYYPARKASKLNPIDALRYE